VRGLRGGSVTTTMDSTMSSDVRSAQSLCRRGSPGEGSKAARRRARDKESSEEHVLLFYRGICACAEHVPICAFPAIRAVRLDKSALASPRATLCTSAFLQVIVAVFQRPGRDDNGNVETKPACSAILHSCSDGTSQASVCACCPLSCCWAPLKRVWPHPLDTHP